MFGKITKARRTEDETGSCGPHGCIRDTKERRPKKQQTEHDITYHSQQQQDLANIGWGSTGGCQCIAHVLEEVETSLKGRGSQVKNVA